VKPASSWVNTAQTSWFLCLWNKLCPSLASLCFLASWNIYDSLGFKIEPLQRVIYTAVALKNFTAWSWPLVRLLLQYFLLGRLALLAINRVPGMHDCSKATFAEGTWRVAAERLLPATSSCAWCQLPSRVRSFLHLTLFSSLTPHITANT